ncbi:hypothetical protein GY45DRAFT_1326991 [Cubamyces sp. BRFM 1775]|nr:hypothetical protein GY45DRAFT_1326991 [Cubamyces sp. BRFM 1775]
MEEDTLAATNLTYDISAIPAPPTSADTICYKNIRLTALRTDPSCFSSTYEREVAFGEETWGERLSGNGKAVFVARRARLPSYSGDGCEKGEHEEAPFVGTLSVVAARALPSIAIPDGADRGSSYFIFGMWVAPDHRRRGVGRKLLEAGVKWAAQDIAEALGEGREDMYRSQVPAEVFLTVAASNKDAKQMYEKSGFESMSAELEGGGAAKEEIWLRCRLTVSGCT